MRAISIAAVMCTLSLGSHQAFAWGDEGHKVVALIAERFLDPGVKVKVQALLDSDTDTLTEHDIASEATWADKYRDSDRNTTKVRYNATQQWHFVDIELSGADAGNEDAGCFHEPQLPSGTGASQGPAKDCNYDKIDEFVKELGDPATPKDEKLLALKFLLHFAGDVHQPLHDSDNHNAGGNSVKVTAKGFKAGNLHHFWDTEFVQALNRNASPIDPAPLADQLIQKITAANRSAWIKDSPKQWAMDGYQLVTADPFMSLPKDELKASHPMTAAYVAESEKTVSDQLKKAGIRLAYLLNSALK